MKKLLAVFLIFMFLVFPLIAFAAQLRCPTHGIVECYDSGQVKGDSQGHLWHKYHCSCGDDFWVD